MALGLEAKWHQIFELKTRVPPYFCHKFYLERACDASTFGIRVGTEFVLPPLRHLLTRRPWGAFMKFTDSQLTWRFISFVRSRLERMATLRSVRAFAVILSLLLMSSVSVALAVVDEPGVFVATQCGPQNYSDSAPSFTVDMDSVCLGRLTPAEDQKPETAVKFLLTDGSDRLFIVRHMAEFLVAHKSGAVKSIYHLEGPNGERLSMQVILDQDGVVKTVSGVLESIHFFIPEFEFLVTTQSH